MNTWRPADVTLHINPGTTVSRQVKNTILLITACVIASTAIAQDASTPSSTPACPPVKSIQAPQLYGAWKIELTANGQTGKLTLRQHPEFSESLRGELSYGATKSIASGDLEEGELNLDESNDRVSLTATWTGKLVESSCGKEIRGEWHDLAKNISSPFILRREAGW